MNEEISYKSDQQREDAEQEEARQATVEQKAQLEDLTKSAAWGMVVAFIDDQTTRRMNEIMLTPIADSKDAASQNFQRGECAGLQLVKRFVTDQLGVTNEAVELYRQLMREQGDLT